ncbi:chemotaxis protein CheA [Candidatus Laterigemmans baculatus]|uniref:chemotaxis protein CheA n=1 Tax=Candidatus Laterigemmans baculatus TaxID=2770505 RepID=UPI0013DA21E9|nr:ATP-binding protein [Candidatus Laterigemmans baculatus]
MSWDAVNSSAEDFWDAAIDPWGAFAATEDGECEGEADACEADGAGLDAPSQQEIRELLAELVRSDDPAACSAAEPRDASPTNPIPANPVPVSSATHESASWESAPWESAAAVELDAEIREAFLDDAGRCLSSIEEAVLKFEAQPENRAPLQQICRELHTLKGAAGSVGLASLAGELHRFEDSLRDSHQASAELPSVEQLFTRYDAIRQQIASVSAGDGGAAAEVEGRPASLPATQPSAGSESVASPPGMSFADAGGDDETVRVKSSQLNRLMDMLAELVMLRNRRDSELSELKGIHRDLLDSVSRLRAVGDPATGDLLETAQRLRDCYQPVAEGNQAVSQFIRQFRQELVELRRMPVSGLFRRLQRVASDAARAEKKQVRLRLIGEDAGIERAMQERLYEPLLHIVRNAVSHGIEEPHERLRQSKEEVGVVTLEALTSSELLVLEIRDDGRGLNYDALRRRGIERGLLDPTMAATREELAQLIFHPGFSTQQAASQVSGRGVGMDVVAAAIARMRGWIEIDSTPGRGTTFRLTFPLPSVIQHTMVFRAGGQIFALPMQFVQAAGSAVDKVRAVPFATLFSESETAGDDVGPTQMLVLASPSGQSSTSGAADARPWSLLVDEILGPEEVVVRPLPSLLKHHPFCSGATLSGMGEVVLVLEKRRLMERVVRMQQQRESHES